MDELPPEDDKAARRAREKAERDKKRKAAKAARKLRKLATKLEGHEELTDWEAEFTEEVSERLDKYGSAFKDPEKGRLDEPLSFAQKAILSQLNKKSRDADKGKPMKRSGFKSKGPKFTPRVRQLDEDFDAPKSSPSKPADPARQAPPTPPKGKPFLRIVKKDEGEAN